jgi:putative endonuclease
MEWLTETPDPVRDLLAGARAELARQTAAGYLERAGLRILDRDWTCSGGKLEIVAAEARVLVICQVRHRPAGGGTPAQPVTRRRGRQLRRLAVRWLDAHGVLFDEVRIDAVILTPGPLGGFDVEHLRGAA